MERSACPICSLYSCEHAAAVEAAFQTFGCYQVAILDARVGKFAIAERELPTELEIDITIERRYRVVS